MVQFISHCTERFSYIDSIRIALEGGCRWIQLRMKDSTEEEIISAAKTARELCDNFGAKLILDDHVELVQAVMADGVHLGRNDTPITLARQMLGKGYIIGGTANTFDDVMSHFRSGADYIGCGPFRFTTTKRNLSPVLGLDGYRDIVSRMKECGIALPIVAIGGITAGDIPSVMSTGVDGIAVSGAVLNAADPVAEMRRLITLTEQHSTKRYE